MSGPSDDAIDFAEEYARDVARGETEDATCMVAGCDELAEWLHNGHWYCDACSIFLLSGDPS